jgi:hypothetical protein
MRPLNIILSVINLYFVVICAVGFAIMLATENYTSAAINLIGAVLNVIAIVILIRVK